MFFEHLIYPMWGQINYLRLLVDKVQQLAQTSENPFKSKIRLLCFGNDT